VRLQAYFTADGGSSTSTRAVTLSSSESSSEGGELHAQNGSATLIEEHEVLRQSREHLVIRQLGVRREAWLLGLAHRRPAQLKGDLERLRGEHLVE
jgi:hypothetical protein